MFIIVGCQISLRRKTYPLENSHVTTTDGLEVNSQLYSDFLGEPLWSSELESKARKDSGQEVATSDILSRNQFSTINTNLHNTAEQLSGTDNGTFQGKAFLEEIPRAKQTGEGRTIYSVFAGRRKFLEVQFVYVRHFLDIGVIDIVHIWNFCLDIKDRRFIEKVSKKDPRFVIVGSGFKLKKGEKVKRKYLRAKLWPSYYAHYSKELSDGDVLIKADDDVVFIQNLGGIVDFVRSTKAKDLALVFPNIVNNEVGTFWQLQEKLIPKPTSLLGMMRTEQGYENLVTCEPIWNEVARLNFELYRNVNYRAEKLTNWSASYQCAWYMHMIFHSYRSIFHSEQVHSWTAPIRVPINFFVLRATTARIFFSTNLFQMKIGVHKWMDDEEVLTHYLQKEHNTTNAMFMNTTVVHYSFDKQSKELGDFWLPPYERLSQKKKFHWGG